MKDYLKELFANQQYEEADSYLKEHITAENYDDEIAIYDGTLGLCFGDMDRVWSACANGLTINPKNYELYVIFGEYYLSKNMNQAYLCYENAHFFCENKEDKMMIEEIMDKLLSTGKVSVRKASFIILSYNLLEFTSNCIESIRMMVPESAREIVVVDNASEDGSVEWLRKQEDIVLVENTENTGFPKGCNIGIEAADCENDIFLLNNDTLMVDNALFWLRMGLYESDEVGTAGSVSNYCGNMQQVAGNIRETDKLMKYGFMNNVPMEFPYEEKLFLIGFALLIKREVYNIVGKLDERFTPGNFEDNDYGLRVLQAGYKNVLCRNSFIIHFGSKTFKKSANTYNDIMQVNAGKFKEKWDIDPRYYFYPRRELVNLIEEPTEKTMNILDIGCGCGAMLGYIKGLYPNTTAYGVEIVEKAAGFAKHMADVVCGDIETLDFPWEEEFFDYIIMGDVLEHLRRPDIVLKRLHKHVKKGGHIIVSMPNVKHYSVILPLLFNDEFTYSDAGILDTTHLKMYTGLEIRKLIEESAFKIKVWGYTNMGEPKGQAAQALEKLLELTGSTNKDQYLAYQYVLKAECI